MIEIKIENPDQAEVHALLAASDAYMASLYPAESNHMVDVNTLKQPHVTFLVARAEGRAVGCGAVVQSTDGWAEIKRMFVSPAARGRQVGRKLLERLEVVAREKGSTALLDAIKATRPRYSIFGHVHQPLASRTRIGVTECLNVGHFRATGAPFVLQW